MAIIDRLLRWARCLRTQSDLEVKWLRGHLNLRDVDDDTLMRVNQCERMWWQSYPTYDYWSACTRELSRRFHSSQILQWD